MPLVFLCPAILAGAVALTGGCATEPQSDRRSLILHPEGYRRIVVLPVFFSGSARTDPTLTLVDLKSFNHQGGSNVTAAVIEALAAKGFAPSALGPALSGDEDWDQLDPAVHGLLADAVLEFRDLIGRRRQLNQPVYPTWPFPNPTSQEKAALPKEFTTRIADLARQLDGGEPEAIVLWQTMAHFESAAARKDRIRWNSTWGAALTPLAIAAALAARGMAGGELPIKKSPSLLHHSVVVVDAHTQQILELHEHFYAGHDARDRNDLHGSVKQLVGDIRRMKPRKPLMALDQAL